MKTNGYGDKLRKLRNAYGLTQSEFGDKIGISRVRVNSYENNITPLPMQVKYKIAEATGINIEYFDNDIDLATAISKYGISSENGKLQIKTNKETICTIYDDLYDFANGRYSIDPYLQKVQILTKLFNLSKPYDYNFVVATNKKAIPFASDGDILVIVKDNIPKDNALLILKVNDEILVKYCRINPFNQNIKLFSTNDDFSNIELSQKELYGVEFLGYIVNIFRNYQPEV
ncbi:TPA: helix-turn-helix domain-containing protein [Campylobacter fetus subsp. venerealis]|uniref:Helix-turn-helix domain-containing protein n=6 Tax=Campylobacter TaxID=194 RepID=A0A6L5WM44_9BACT|nr:MULTISPECIES: helix-turn-helix domain-containing protein [Campylobacter]OCS29778.1 hypothetical protein CFVCCUG33900_05365 [Campylobacter fetus subsp. venerealis LMG 6570 = CCUG 33900]OCS40000.1 hypothetical protein CFVI02298_09200 [Campylobacter fetus subsp. venerealis cfvi02/298]ACS15169.1 hypothetical protein [Campylobacter fetus subsp. venerealis NCTC 10354]AHE94529.1 putative transcriptional regulator, XRE family (peptidase S24 LexA-like domain) [Campylobacter fetus subsp. venerealis cf